MTIAASLHADGRVAWTSFSTFLRAVHDEKIPLQKLTGEDRNEGAPRVEIMRGVFRYAEEIGALLRARPSPFSYLQLLLAAAAAGHETSTEPFCPHPGEDSRALPLIGGGIRSHAGTRAPAHQRASERHADGRREKTPHVNPTCGAPAASRRRGRRRRLRLCGDARRRA